MYRYRDTSGSTNNSLKAIKHIPKVGNVLYIKGYNYLGKHDVNHCAVLVKGDKGSARFANFSWGYSGQGPRGLKEFLEKLNVDKKEIDRVLSINWDGWDNVGEVWKINLEENNGT